MRLFRGRDRAGELDDPREDSPEGREEIVAEIYRAMSIANLRK